MSMRVCVLGSGSRGNCTLIQTGGTALLVDAARLGIKYIENSLDNLGVRPSDINGIVATHVHGDHVDPGTTARLCNTYDIPLYIHHDTYPDLVRRSSKFETLEKAGLVRQFDFLPFRIGDVTIDPFPVTHGGEFGNDVVGRPVGYTFMHGEGDSVKKIGFSTDLGHLDSRGEEALLNSDVIVLECNHDEDAEYKSSRPWFLVRWVLGPRGHLSNEQCGDALKRIVSRGRGRTKNIVLAHLSAECNRPEWALAAVRKHLEMVGCENLPLHVALQHELSPCIEA